MTQRRAFGIFSCLLFLWPCLSSLTGKAIEDAGEGIIWTEIQSPIRLSYRTDESGKQHFLAERIQGGSDVRALTDIHVKVESSLKETTPSVLGKSNGDGDQWRFYPSFSLQPGLNYVVAVMVGHPSEAFPFIFNLPAEKKESVATISGHVDVPHYSGVRLAARIAVSTTLGMTEPEPEDADA